MLIILFATFLLALTYTGISIALNLTFHVLIDGTITVLVLVLLKFLQRRPETLIVEKSLFVMFWILFTALYMVKGVDIHGYLWVFPMPGILMFLRGAKLGGIGSFMILIPMAIVHLFGHRVSWLTDLPPILELSLLGSYISLTLTVYLFQYFSERYQLDLVEVNNQLERSVLERTEALEAVNLQLREEVEVRSAAEASMAQALAEKEVLIKEVYHRTKNNMNVISSLLNLQSMHNTSGNIADILQTVQRRIQSMASVHEKLYRSENVAALDLGEYIHELILQLAAAMSDPDLETQIDHEAEEVKVGLDQAIPLGLVMNEILTNAFKHGQVPGKPLTITSRITSQSDQQQATLFIGDNGPGMSKEAMEASGTLGNQLIRILLHDQLDAHYEVASDHGLSYTIRLGIRNPIS